MASRIMVGSKSLNPATQQSQTEHQSETIAVVRRLVGGLLRAICESRPILQGEIYAVGKGVVRHERVDGVVEAEGIDADEDVVLDGIVV